MNEITATFNKYSYLDYLSVHELDKALRHTGFAIAFDRQRDMTFSLDADMSGQLNLKEFVKLIRLCITKDIEFVVDTFNEFARQDSPSRLMAIGDAFFLLKTMGFVHPDGTPVEVNMDWAKPSRKDLAHCFDIYDIVGMLHRCYEGKRQFMRNHHRFSPQEVDIYAHMFDTADENRSNDLTHPEVFKVMEEYYS